MGVNCAYRIATAKEDWVERGISEVPQYGARVASAIRRTIEMIRGLQDFHRSASTDELVIYLGRGLREHVLRHRRGASPSPALVLTALDVAMEQQVAKAPRGD